MRGLRRGWLVVLVAWVLLPILAAIAYAAAGR